MWTQFRPLSYVAPDQLFVVNTSVPLDRVPSHFREAMADVAVNALQIAEQFLNSALRKLSCEATAVVERRAETSHVDAAARFGEAALSSDKSPILLVAVAIAEKGVKNQLLEECRVNVRQDSNAAEG